MKKKPTYGNSHCKVCSGTAFDTFIFTEINIDDSNKVFRRTSDVDVILNQRSFMSKMGVENLRQYIQDLMSRSDSVNTFDTTTFSDDDLLTFTKSRYINSFSDMEQYARQINYDMATLKEHIKRSNDYQQRYRSLFDTIDKQESESKTD